MRKEKTNQKIIRRAITWVMAVLITFSSVGGNFGVMTVYANEEGTSDEQVQAPMSAQAETATTAVNTATEAKDNAKSEADRASDAVNEAESAVNVAKEVVESATGLSKEAVLKNVSDTTSIDAYNANVAADQQNDLAIIKINDTSYKNVSQLPYGLLSRTKDTGSEVFALGYPMADVMGDEVKFTDGKISSRSGIQGDIRVYQISVPIQPGNSGGPLFDMNGNIVGITSSGLNRDYFKSENVNYAIKASYLKTLMESCPQKIVLEEKEDISITKTSLTEKIKQYEDFVVLILTK